ncbi:MAG: glycosyl hydrolase [Cyclobacteriaceae bacterium]|nr:glycosyl hydrolase [Cyclobacteriaceae bacterium]
MKKILFFYLLGALTIVSCKNTSTEISPVNPNATKEARELLHHLYSIDGEFILSGQHNYGNELLRSTDSVKSITGELPAIWGSDMLPLRNGDQTMQDVVDEAIRQHEMGSIITLMYHQVKPFDHDSLGFGRSVKGMVTDEEWAQIVTPGTDYYNMLIEKIDKVASYLKQLQDKNIPVLWRPYHEMNGIWFWYGDRKGEDGFVKLWKIMYDRYVNYHKLDNLIWVWNPNAPRDWENDQAYDYQLYYPGDKFVDVLAADIYKNDYKQSHHDQLLELGKGKLIAIGECGVLPTPAILEQQPHWVWFMDWAGFVWRENHPDSVRALYQYEKVLNLGDAHPEGNQP